MDIHFITGKMEYNFLGYDIDLYDMIVDGYTHHVDGNGNKMERRMMIDQQKKDYKNHHKARTILLNTISYIEYEKIIIH